MDQNNTMRNNTTQHNTKNLFNEIQNNTIQNHSTGCILHSMYIVEGTMAVEIKDKQSPRSNFPSTALFSS